ncbi:MAG: hypothetical protein IGS48_23640 [Oscillatoriales cyanobacterium C42_A2020_001]|nr:hypothetical protein [Leptolyngbyaceae cyanobacterium C42_A2020_001]
MIRLLTLFALTTSLIACSHELLANGPSSTSTGDTAMMTKTNVVIKHVSLTAREERSLPSGVKPDRDRPIGFASIFFELENKLQQTTTITIQKIEVCDAFTGFVQLKTDQPQTIQLKPLEIYANNLQLTNKTGFSGFGKVKARVTVQIGNQQETIESLPVAIEKY